ncbi:hypothetical protein [Embleya sp. NBC_00896]|uniref:hypothetical protein n=1 Tax=Embleya sp. NBC_00896 TaxID=2975961 RepID=UPI0038682649|nr:hypothetical protein OG928_07035 [Embleya sp. NBC_00896]
MGLDDAIRGTQGATARAAAAGRASREVTSQTIAEAEPAIRGLFADALARLPAVHPTQVLRVRVSEGRRRPGRHELVDRLWPLAGVLVGSDLAMYLPVTIDVGTPGEGAATTARTRLHDRLTKSGFRGTRVLAPDAQPLDLPRQIAVVGEAVPATTGPNDYSWHGGYLGSGGHFVAAQGGTVLVPVHLPAGEGSIVHRRLDHELTKSVLDITS